MLNCIKVCSYTKLLFKVALILNTVSILSNSDGLSNCNEVKTMAVHILTVSMASFPVTLTISSFKRLSKAI